MSAWIPRGQSEPILDGMAIKINVESFLRASDHELAEAISTASGESLADIFGDLPGAALARVSKALAQTITEMSRGKCERRARRAI